MNSWPLGVSVMVNSSFAGKASDMPLISMSGNKLLIQL